MKREILFRAKSIDNGEWIEGWLVNNSIVSYLQIDEYDEKHDLFKCDCVIHDIIPKTIGQYTGLKDKNGVKIFDGDYVGFYGSKIKDSYFIYDLDGLLKRKTKHGNFSMNTREVHEENVLEVLGNIHE